MSIAYACWVMAGSLPPAGAQRLFGVFRGKSAVLRLCQHSLFTGFVSEFAAHIASPAQAKWRHTSTWTRLSTAWKGASIVGMLHVCFTEFGCYVGLSPHASGGGAFCISYGMQCKVWSHSVWPLVCSSVKVASRAPEHQRRNL